MIAAHIYRLALEELAAEGNEKACLALKQAVQKSDTQIKLEAVFGEGPSKALAYARIASKGTPTT